MYEPDKPEENRTEIRDEFPLRFSTASIMMVDDEPTTMEEVRTFLEKAGYEKFILIEQPSQTIKTLEEENPDILLLDLVMPEMSGFEVLSVIRAHPKFKHLPVIILTSSTETGSKLMALDLGATDFLAKPVDPSELVLRVRNTLVTKAYIDQLVYYDPVTKLPNKHLFLEHFDRSLIKAKGGRSCMALLNIEMDNFDKINDTIGLYAGDEVLRLITGRIKNLTRSIDMLVRFSPEVETEMNLYRLEGGVFLLLLNRLSSSGDAAIVAERIIQAIKKPFIFEDQNIYAAASIGIAVCPPEGDDHTALMRLASSAKDYVRNRGGNSFQFSSSSINGLYEKRRHIEAELRKSLDSDGFLLYYQPKVDVATDVIHGVEALIRMNGRDNVIVPPNEFIKLAEDTGLIIPIGEWVLQKACAQLKELHQTCRFPISMSVNLSVQQFTDPGLFSMLERTIDNSGIEPDFLILELTESLLLDDIENKIKILKELTDMGIKLSIDDFGTGYSSLMYLNKLPVHELKIDRSFMSDLVDNSNNRSIILSVIFLADRLGLKTVAEGIETKEQLHFLQEHRCNQYQGFLFSKPLPASELIELIRLKS